jgi:hypothetical protein
LSGATDAVGVPPPPSEAHQKAGLENQFTQLLREALTHPGVVNAAYCAFHHYSMSNQLLAAVQLTRRGLPLSPTASFNGWNEKGRSVRKGQKAVGLFMPVSDKRKDMIGAQTATADDEENATFTVFMLRNNWFSLDQTDGEPFAPEQVVPSWDAGTTMSALDVRKEPFNDVRGNLLGYAMARTIALNPLNDMKHKTRFHELVQVVLGRTAVSEMVDEEELLISVMEAKAESVAYRLCALLNLPGQAQSRHYIQHWLTARCCRRKALNASLVQPTAS